MTINDVKDLTSFKWATVTSVSPLAVKLDGDSAALLLTPDTMIDPLELLVNDRVRVELTERKVVVHGLSGGVSRLQTATDAAVATNTAKLATLTSYALRTAIPTNTRIRSRAPYTYGSDRDPSVAFWAVKSSGGVVTIEGLGSGFSPTVAAGTTIATLPAGYRPATNSRFPYLHNGNTRGYVTITTAGAISLSIALTASSDYISLANVVFLEASAANALTWTTPTLNTGSGWSAVSGATPQWAVDAYGVVWLRGRAAKSGTWVGNQQIFNVPAPYRPQLMHHMSAVSAALYGYAAVGGITATGGAASGDVVSKNAVAGVDLSFDGMFWAPASLDANFTLWGATNYTEPLGDNGILNSWVNYGAASFAPLAMWKRSDGFVMIRGFMGTGAMGTRVANTPPGMRQGGGRLFRECVSNEAVGNLVIYGNRINDSSDVAGGLLPNIGSSTWFSLDGIGFNSGE